MNDYLFQVAMVINTSHDNFYDNLMNIVIYILGCDMKKVIALSVQEIMQNIENKIKLEFTEKEIQKAIIKGMKKNYIFESSDEYPSKYSLGEEGIKKIHLDNLDKFSECVDAYIKTYEISSGFTNEKISELIQKFLYGCIGENIDILVLIVRGEYEENADKVHGFNNAERKIINDFLDWENEEKDEILFRLISFSVDYSRLTVKKSTKQFNDLLKGKVFYLDANIFFRLMGINNLKRKETTQKFIEKCKEENIKLLYTNITRQEIFDSLDYHVGELKKFVQLYRGYGSALNNALKQENMEKGFYMEYYHWARRENSFGKFEEFKSYLKSQFYQCSAGISCEEIDTYEIDNNLVEDLMNKKQNKTGHDNVVIDIKNLCHVKNKRKKNSGNIVSWNTKYYLITADHRLIEWVDEKYSPRNPIAVLPSVWYSLILKLKGREKDGYQSFIEFIKLRYIQEDTSPRIMQVLNAICQKTSNGELQDRLLDEIYDNNKEFNALSKVSKDDVEKLVDEKYDNILEKERAEAYAEGKNIGEKGIIETALNNREIGMKIGHIEEQINQINRNLVTEAQYKSRKNKFIIIGGNIIVYLLALLLFSIVPYQVIKDYKWFISILPAFFTYILSSNFFLLRYKDIYDELRFEKKNELDDLQAQLEKLEKEK